MHVQDHTLEFSKSFLFDGTSKKLAAVRRVCPKLATVCQNLNRLNSLYPASPNQDHGPTPYLAPVLGEWILAVVSKTFDKSVKMIAP